MATSPKAATARKSLPQTTLAATPSSQGGTYSEQQRKSSTTSQSSQQRKNSTASQGSPMAGNKRKAKTETKTPAAVRGKKAGAPVAEMVPPPKKSRGAEEMTDTNEGAIWSPPAKARAQAQAQAYAQVQSQAQSPAQTLPPTPTRRADTHANQSPASGRTNADVMTRQLLMHAVRSDATLLPFDSPNSRINSTHIDSITHAMWQIAFNHGPMLQQACIYSAMFAPLKLAALAKLNFLPSWWFFREMAVKILVDEGRGGTMDDRVMQTEWLAACHWCKDMSRTMPGFAGGSAGQGDGGMKAEGGAEE